MANSYDVIVIGAGPGGYVAAIRAAQLGLRTAIVEREHLGGICLNWGCIPTKALLRSAEIFQHLKHAPDFGLTVEKTSFDITAVSKRSREVSARLNGGVGFLLKKNKIDIIWGEAKIEAGGVVTVGKPASAAQLPQHPIPKKILPAGAYKAKHIILATGARPRQIPNVQPDGAHVWTYFEAMKPDSLPKSLIVLGSGAIGIEFASFYRSMGTQVTVIELLPQILPAEDSEIAALARKSLEKQGIKILTDAKVSAVETSSKNVTATFEQKDGKTTRLEAEKLISAVGVVGNIENLGLEELGVKTDRGCIVTDDFGATNIKGVYAIGDVAGPPMLAHKAEHEGVACIEKIAGKNPHGMERDKIPGCTYCHPQIASVGLSEKAAQSAGYDIRVGRFPFAANGMAIALGGAEGLVKTIFDAKSGQLLGAHMIGDGVAELIHGFCVAMNLETSEEELMRTVFPHPTLSEMMHESVLDAYGRAIHA